MKSRTTPKRRKVTKVAKSSKHKDNELVGKLSLRQLARRLHDGPIQAVAALAMQADLANRLRRLRNHGRKDKYEHIEPGYGERLDTLQAAILHVKLSRLANWNVQRRQWAARYSDGLNGIPELQTPCPRSDSLHIFHQYVIRHPRRDSLAAHLKSCGIQTGIHYPIPLHLQPALRDLGYGQGDLPVTENLAGTILSLPIFPELTTEEVDHVVKSIRAFRE